MVFVVFGFQDLSQINGQAKGGKRLACPPLPLSSFLPSRVELFGISVCVCLKNWRYLRAFVFSVSVESFWILLLLFFSRSSVYILYIFHVLSSAFLCFCCSLFSVFAMNHAPVVRQFELTLRGVGGGRRGGTEDSRLINNHQSSYTQ